MWEALTSYVLRFMFYVSCGEKKEPRIARIYTNIVSQAKRGDGQGVHFFEHRTHRMHRSGCGGRERTLIAQIYTDVVSLAETWGRTKTCYVLR